jgi:hypothetical protein
VYNILLYTDNNKIGKQIKLGFGQWEFSTGFNPNPNDGSV